MGAEREIESDDAVRLAKAAREREVRERSDRILAIAADIRSHFKLPLPSSDHSFLYDEDGLPT